KHNIGAYALAGSLAIAVIDDDQMSLRLGVLRQRMDRALIILAGFLAPVVPMLVYMRAHHALGAMTRALLFGPGEFLVDCLAAVPSPDVPLIYLALMATVALVAARLSKLGASIVWGIAAFANLVVFLLGPQPAIDKLVFYVPVIVIAGAVAASLFMRRIPAPERRALLLVTVAAAAAFMEAFPRF